MKYAIAIILGSLAGFLYYKFVGCNTGSCPITSNPTNTMIYGALMGLVLVWK